MFEEIEVNRAMRSAMATLNPEGFAPQIRWIDATENAVLTAEGAGAFTPVSIRQVTALETFMNAYRTRVVAVGQLAADGDFRKEGTEYGLAYLADDRVLERFLNRTIHVEGVSADHIVLVVDRDDPITQNLPARIKQLGFPDGLHIVYEDGAAGSQTVPQRADQMRLTAATAYVAALLGWKQLREHALSMRGGQFVAALFNAVPFLRPLAMALVERQFASAA